MLQDKQAEENRKEGRGSSWVKWPSNTQGATKGGGQRWSSLATVGGADVGMHDGEGADADRYGARPDLVWA